MMMYKGFFKRLLDLILASIGLVILLPIILLVVILLFISNKGSIFFFQDRPGLNNKVFRLIKFKTMNDQLDKNGRLLPDAQRISRVGRIIRATSLDELPQLYNVIKGDMSLVGPRPLLVQYLTKYSQKQMRRQEVRPGITGWSQINGRNSLSWTSKFELDVWYVDHLSLLLDLKILILTVIKVFKREGINSNETITMPPFMGNS